MFVYCKHYVSLYFDSSGRSGVIETIYVFIQHAEKHGCVSTSDKNRTCVGQVCGFLYLFVRKLHARGFTHAMRTTRRKQRQVREIKQRGPSRAQLDVSIIFTRIYDLITRLLAAQCTPDTANRH